MKKVLWVTLLATQLQTARCLEKSVILNNLGLSVSARESMRGHMNVLQVSTQSILEMVSRGQWEELRKEGDKISKINLILGRSTTLPPDFQGYANELRDSAREMAIAAGKSHGGGVLANYYRMVGTCMKCHADYAPNYFDRRKDYVPPQEIPVKHYKSPYDWQ